MKPVNYPETPQHLSEHFYRITRIPRPSGKEQAICRYITELAEAHGCSSRQDDAGNLVVRVPASPGYESCEPLIIQNHVDMVTVKSNDKNHNFESDPLELKVIDGWLYADCTTLGADNGVGCAAALALMTDPEVQHPDLELLFTVEEETGLYGASGLDISLLQGTRMLNLDTEDWGELYIGCAGARGWSLSAITEWEIPPEDSTGISLELKGLAGGHSGLQIHQQLGNAVKLLADWCSEAGKLGFRLGSADIGLAHNVIPREGHITGVISSSQWKALEQLSARMLNSWKHWLPEADQGIQLVLKPAEERPGKVLSVSCAGQVIRAAQIFPHGAQAYNPAQPADLVDLSINLARLVISPDKWNLLTSMRFFSEEQSRMLASQINALAETFDLKAEVILNYPGWEPDFSSDLLQQAAAVYERLSGTEPAVKAIHAGLECGIIKSKRPELDIISIGPTIKGAHSPSERLELATLAPFWEFLCELVKQSGRAADE